MIPSEPPQLPKKGIPKKARAYLEELLQWLNESQAVPGLGMSASEQANGRLLSAGARGGGGVADITPFQILEVPKNPAAPGATQKIGVAFYSLLTKLDFTKVEITGLLASNTPLFSDAAAFAVPAIGEKIWLEIATTDQDAPTAQIRHGAVGGGLWDEFPKPNAINIDGETADPHTDDFQEFCNVLIAEVTDFESDQRPALLTFKVGEETRQITQMFSRNIQLAQWAQASIVCLMPVNPSLNYEPTI